MIIRLVHLAFVIFQSMMLESMLHHACLLADVLSTSVSYSLLSTDDAVKCTVYLELKVYIFVLFLYKYNVFFYKHLLDNNH